LAGHVAHIGETEMYAIFWLENLNGRELGRSKSKWEDDIRIDLRVIGWECVN